MSDASLAVNIARASLMAAAGLAPLLAQLAVAGCVVPILAAVAQRATNGASFATRAIVLQALTILLFVFSLTRVIPHASASSAVAAVAEPSASAWQPAPLIIAPPAVGKVIAATRADERTPWIAGVVVVTWIAGAAWLVLRMMLGAWQLAAIRRRARFASAAGTGAIVLVSEEVDIPFVTGLWRPAIVLPAASEAWSPVERRMVLAHESSHVLRGDVAMQWVRQLVRALHWFNPAVSWLARRADEACEGACDDVVLTRGADPVRYANTLVELAARGWMHGAAPSPTIIGRSGLERRLRAMVATGRHRRSAARLDRLAPRLIGLAGGVVLAAFWPRFALGVTPAAPLTPVARYETDAFDVPAGFRANALPDRQAIPRVARTMEGQQSASDTTNALLALGDALHDVNPIVRVAAVRALASWKSDASIERLLRIAHGPGKRRRAAARAAIAAMEGAQ